MSFNDSNTQSDQTTRNGKVQPSGYGNLGLKANDGKIISVDDSLTIKPGSKLERTVKARLAKDPNWQPVIVVRNWWWRDEAQSDESEYDL